MCKEIQKGFDKVGFEGCVGLVDGTLVVLATTPQLDGQDYYNRKGHYGIVTLLFCDQNKNILFVETGWPGCSHNQRLMSNSILASKSQDFFLDGEYVLADSAFTPTANVVPTFKRNKYRHLTDEENDFNRHHSGVRVLVENCIGLLKNRFQSLKGLRLRVSSKQDLIRVNAWILVCPFL